MVNEKRLNKRLYSGMKIQEYPLSELLVKHNLTPFQIVIGMEGLHNENSLEEYAENNLVLWIRRKWNEIHNEFEFQISCKSRSFSSLQQFANSYCYVLKQVSQNPNLALKDICIIAEEEKELLERIEYFSNGYRLVSIISRFV